MSISQITKSPWVQTAVRAGNNDYVKAVAILIAGIALTTLVSLARRMIVGPKRPLGCTIDLSSNLGGSGGEDPKAGPRNRVARGALDTVLKALCYHSPWNHEADGIVLHPDDLAAGARAVNPLPVGVQE